MLEMCVATTQERLDQIKQRLSQGGDTPYEQGFPYLTEGEMGCVSVKLPDDEFVTIYNLVKTDLELPDLPE
jgi:hypothetical protein